MKAATDIILSPVENYALVMYGCLLIQNRLHMNLYTVAHLCSMNICGMISFGGLLSEQLPCYTVQARARALTTNVTRLCGTYYHMTGNTFEILQLSFLTSACGET